LFDNISILVTGGTGSFGKKFIQTVLSRHKPKRIVIFSRDELKQHDMRSQFPDSPGSPIRYFLGDVRDPDRLRRAFHGVDIVVHAAALKQVPACEYNPFEAILTNVMGAKNIIDAAIDVGVPKVLALSTDKAVNPVNLYGASKLAAEKLFVQGNAYAGGSRTMFSCTRYGNVVGSRGSVVPLFKKQAATGRLTVTDKHMTRFWLTLEQGVEIVLKAIEHMQGGEIFVPKIPSMSIMDLASAIAPNCQVDYVGIRPGEKLHEVLISEDEARHTIDVDDMYIIKPEYYWRAEDPWRHGKAVPSGFKFVSNENKDWLTAEQMKQLSEKF
jgi:UDP-N-acetylglucosamine 4,6-dehydratase